MARIGRSLTKHAGSKALALLAALALWVLVAARSPSGEPLEASVIEASVAVKPIWLDAESSPFVIEEFRVVPASLKIGGPAARMSLLDHLATEPIDVAAIVDYGSVEAAVILPDPELRFVDNPVVRVEVKMRRR